MNVGSIYVSNNYGPVRIMSVDNSYATVEFLNTKTICRFRKCWIESGCIRDPYAKTVCGVACTGNIKTKGKFAVYYSIWHDMINRCYNKNNKRYNAYKNVSVSDEWLIFENFYNDCRSLDGFDEDLIRSGELTLDKDTKQRFKDFKIYSKETCIWINKKDNAKIQDSQQRVFYAKSPDGQIYIDFNITQFAKEHNLNRKNISAILHNKGKTTHGWKFSYEEIV